MSGALDHLLGRLRGLRGDSDAGGSEVVHEVQAAIPHDVVLTHDGSLLFAYAADEAVLTATRRAIENVLIPRLQGTVRYIKFRFDELERDAFSMLKTVKRKMEREEAAASASA